jgi:hypothetical protein
MFPIQFSEKMLKYANGEKSRMIKMGIINNRIKIIDFVGQKRC